MLAEALSPLSVFMNELQRQSNSEMIHIECDNAKTPCLPCLWHLREEVMPIQRPHSMTTMYEAKRKKKRDGLTSIHIHVSGTDSTGYRTGRTKKNSMPVSGTIPRSASVSRWEVGCYSPTSMKDKTVNVKWDSSIEVPFRRLSAEEANLAWLAQQMVSVGHSSCPNLPTSSFLQDNSAFVCYPPDYQTSLAAVRQRFSPTASIFHTFPKEEEPSACDRGSSMIFQATTQDLLRLPMRRASIEDEDIPY